MLNFTVFTVAIVLGIMVTVWPTETMRQILAVTRFFEVMLPVLAVGALIKYLCGGSTECK